MQTVNLTEAKTKLSALVADVADTMDRVEITRNGKPAAILISPDDLFALEETLAILRDPELMKELEQSRAEIADGKGIPIEEIIAEFQRTNPRAA